MVMPLVPLKAQTLAKNDALKFDADYYLMEKEFTKAKNIYLTILKSEPENADIKFRLGICYLNSEDEKTMAIPFLEDAAQKISQKYSPSSFKEMDAPIDALFLLGSAYRVNNQLDEAISAYSRYRDLLDSRDEYNLEVTNQYINSCNLAREMQQKPITLISVNMGSPVNSSVPNFNAVLSGDGKIMLYTTPGRQGYDIYSTTLGDTAWTTPKLITSVLGTGKYMKTTDLSTDGLSLLLVLDDPMNAEIFESHFTKGRWSKVEPLGKEINSKSNETHASYSSDGKTLYFTSNRKGGLGDLDIYKSALDAKGEWGKPVNLGSEINTKFNEETPFVTDDGQTLYFSSEGHSSIGGYDIYRYHFNDPGAGAINLGYPLNTTDNDLFYVPTGDGISGYYSQRGPDSYGGRDIYRVTVIEPVEVVIAEEIPAVEVPVEEMTPAMVETVPDMIPEELPALPVVVEPVVEEAVAVVTETIEQVVPEEIPAAPAVEEPMVETPPEVAEVPADVAIQGARTYVVQFMALKKPADLAAFTGLSNITVTYGSDKWYRYTYASSTEMMVARKALDKAIEKGYRDAFIRGKQIIPQFTVQVMAVPGPVVDLTRFSNLSEIAVTRGEDSFCRYTTGEFETREEALAHLERVRQLGYDKAFVARIAVH